MNNILLLLLLVFVSCSTNLAGGGTEGGNTDIFATVISSVGDPSPGAEILLSKQASLPSERKYQLRADDAGVVLFDTVPDGTYTVFGRSKSGEEQLLYHGIELKDGKIAKDSLRLDSTAAVRVIIPPLLDVTESGDIILNGTDLSEPLSTAVQDTVSGLWQVEFDRVPSGNIGRFLFWDGDDDFARVSGDISTNRGEELTVEEELVWSKSKDLSLTEGCIVYSMTLDSSGQLWIGTSVDGIFRYDGHSWISESESGDVAGLVWDMITLPDGTIVYCGDKGVLKRENGDWVHFEGMNFPENSKPYALAYKEESDELFIGFDTLGLFCWKDNELSQVLHTGGWFTVFDLAIDSSGRVWAATNEGSFYRDGDGWFKLVSNPLLPPLPTFSVSTGGDGVWFNHGTSLSLFKDDQWSEQVDHSMGQTLRIAADPHSGKLYSAGFDFITIYEDGEWLKYRSTNGEIGENGVFSILIVGSEVHLGITNGVLSFTTRSY